MHGSIPSTALNSHPMGCSRFLARGFGAGKQHSRAVWVLRSLRASFVMEGRVIEHGGGVEVQHRRCQQFPVKPRAQRVRGQADLVGGHGWSKACFLPRCEANTTVSTPCSSGMLATKCPADPGAGARSQARLRGAEGTVPGPAGSPPGPPLGSPAWAGSAWPRHPCARRPRDGTSNFCRLVAPQEAHTHKI